MANAFNVENSTGTPVSGMDGAGNITATGVISTTGNVQAATILTNPPTVVTPGTVASGNAVFNGTGADCMVYMSASTGISKVVVGAGTVLVSPSGTVSAGQTFPAYTPAGQAVTVTYAGNLTWSWLGI